MPWNRPLIIGLLLVVTALSWWRLHPDEEQLRRTRLIMGTVVEILVEAQPSARLEKAVDEAFAEMERLDQLLSRYRKQSEVTRLSASATGMTVSAETARIIALGLEVAQRSGGAFDMTLGRLKALWGIDTESQQVPDPGAIRSALNGIGPNALSLHDQDVVKRSPQLSIDLGGIAKGYAVDRAIAILKERGVTGAAINAGGDMYLLGSNGGRPWHIGIQHPRQPQAVIETVQVQDRAVVTSGDYERFFMVAGQRYHHIFDPATGRPAEACQSVTVIADSVALADALATAIFVLGPVPGLQLLQDYAEAEALVIDRNGDRHESRGWPRYRISP